MLENLNTVQSILDKTSQVIPDYNLDLTDLPVLNTVLPSSPEMKASSEIIQNLNDEVQKTWSDASSSSNPNLDRSISPLKSDDTL